MIFRPVYNDWQDKDKMAAPIINIKISETLSEINLILKIKKYFESD
jgi:hypothetical protein